MISVSLKIVKNTQIVSFTMQIILDILLFNLAGDDVSETLALEHCSSIKNMTSVEGEQHETPVTSLFIL